MTGSYQYPEQYPEQTPPLPYPDQAVPPVPSAYPGALPPPVPYPTRRRWPRILAVLAVVIALAGALVAVWTVARRSPAGPVTVSDTQAQAAIQAYLDALSNGDDETIARNALCGLYDGVTDLESDLAVAGLASDAFRKQFSHVEVTSIDKNVAWSTTQAQVLFSMRVTPTRPSRRGQGPGDEEQQGVAQLLVQRDGADQQVLVCSYVLRTAGLY